MDFTDQRRFGAEEPSPPGSPAAPRSWWSRNWAWFVPVGLAVLCLCPIGCCGGFLGVLSTTIKSSEPYEAALARVQQDPQVRQRLGEPIQDATWFAQGNVEIQNQSGSARIDFKVAGPNGAADVHTEATRENSEWRTTRLQVSYPDGETVNLAP